MKTKFIGLDGFQEIETVANLKRKKKISFSSLLKTIKKFLKISCTIAAESIKDYKTDKKLKKSSKPTRPEQHYANQRKQGSQSIATSAAAMSKMHNAKKKALKHAGKAAIISKNFLKHKVALGVATSFVAVLLCVMTTTSTISFSAFAADEKSSSPVVQDETEKITVNDTQLSKTVHSDISQSMSDDDILTDGYGLYIDNELAGVSLDKDALENALQKALDDYKAKYDDETTDKFANDVEIVFGAYKSIYVDDSENIVKNNMDKFSYSLSTDIEYTQKVPFTTTVKYDKTKYTSYSKVIQKGISGKQKIIYRVTYVDGIQTDSYVSATKTVKKAQNKIIVKGTKQNTTTSVTSNATSYVSGYGSASASGSFMWPLPYTHNITSGYGARWGSMHTGIDISAGSVYGKAVVASDGGTVEWAGWDSSGYGNYVIINHGNGYKTLYGHCSAVYVSRGQSVSKGATIAAVGSTGDSTGPHLHFEVRTSGGSRLNPLGFVS